MNYDGCINNTVITSTGLYFDYANPTREQIDIKDIAKSLSNICRFNGQCTFYSVAEHCVHCFAIANQKGCDRDILFYALMHDAAEAYLGDIPKPLKIMLPDFQKLETRVENLINTKFCIDTKNKKLIKEIDLQMLKAEKLFLFPEDQETWLNFDLIEKIEIDIKCWNPTHAEYYFLEAFKMVGC